MRTFRRLHSSAPTPFLAMLAVLAILTALGGCSPAVRGSVALSQGDYQQALSLYNDALAKNPDSLHLRQRIALTYFTMKDYAKAEQSYRDILTRWPDEPETVFYLGLSRIGKGEANEALADLTRLHWPFKYYHQKFVRDEAARLLNHPGMPAGEIIANLRDALEKGREEQRRFEIESQRMLSD